jgi:calcium-dependent protein kinase
MMYFFVFQVIAESLSEEEIMGLKEMFRMMDTDNSGTITFEELKEGLQKQGSNLAESEVRQLMAAVSIYLSCSCLFPTSEVVQVCDPSLCLAMNKFHLGTHDFSLAFVQADVDGNGTIDYLEFITATMHLNKIDREDHLYTAFQHFDADGSG